MRPRTRRWVLLAVAVGAAGALAGGVVASALRDFDDPAGLAAAIEHDPLVRVAEIPAADGAAARGIYAQATSTGHLCLWEAPSPTSRRRQGGCNDLDDPLAGEELSFSLAYEGGPATRSVREARVFGLASSAVARVQVLMSDATRRDVPIRETAALGIGGTAYASFAYRFGARDLARGVGPVAVIALDAQGAEIDRQTTGFGG